jgi:hypothetical protein
MDALVPFARANASNRPTQLGSTARRWSRQGSRRCAVQHSAIARQLLGHIASPDPRIPAPWTSKTADPLGRSCLLSAPHLNVLCEGRYYVSRCLQASGPAKRSARPARYTNGPAKGGAARCGRRRSSMSRRPCAVDEDNVRPSAHLARFLSGLAEGDKPDLDPHWCGPA